MATCYIQNSYKKDRAWADLLLPKIKRILLENLANISCIRTSSEEEDMKESADLIAEFLDGSPEKVAVRSRDILYKKYKDITIRSKRETGAATEIDKIKGGQISYYFYHWITPDSFEWVLLDVKKMIEKDAFQYADPEITNKDGLTFFVPIKIKKLRELGCILSECVNE